MATVNCSTIKELFVDGITENTSSQKIGEACVVSLPIPTVDGRYVDIFIEPRAANLFLLHDGGKAFNELILQGADVTEASERRLSMLATAYAVAWSDEMFQSVCKIDRVYQMAMAIGMCSSIAVSDLSAHFASVEEEPVREQADVALRHWAKKRAKITRNEPVEGTIKQHNFDFVARSKGFLPIAISVLSPGGSPLGAAERFGFKVQDISSPTVQAWPKIVVQARAELWTNPARKILERCSTDIIPIRSNEMLRKTAMSEIMDQALRKTS
jgi:hypothetical protein